MKIKWLKKNKINIEKAIDYVAGYCNKHSSCEECPLTSDDGCKLRTTCIPDWTGKELLKEEAKNE